MNKEKSYDSEDILKTLDHHKIQVERYLKEYIETEEDELMKQGIYINNISQNVVIRTTIFRYGRDIF
jgi:hypothetical protein